MTFKGKKKELIVLGAFIAVLAILFLLPGRAPAEPQEEADPPADHPREEEELEYMKEYAWYTEDGDNRYWLLFFDKETEDGEEICGVLTYTEHLDVKMDGNDFSGRFTDTVYYEAVSADGEMLTVKENDGRVAESLYRMDRQEKRMILYPLDEKNGETFVFHGTSFDDLVYPTY